MSTAPVLQIRTPAIPQSHPSTRSYLSPAELLAVLKIARARSTRDWFMILIAYRHGLSASEVCELRLSVVNLKDQLVHVAWLKAKNNT
jgi:integrase